MQVGPKSIHQWSDDAAWAVQRSMFGNADHAFAALFPIIRRDEVHRIQDWVVTYGDKCPILTSSP